MLVDFMWSHVATAVHLGEACTIAVGQRRGVMQGGEGKWKWRRQWMSEMHSSVAILQRVGVQQRFTLHTYVYKGTDGYTGSAHRNGAVPKIRP